MEDKSVTSHPGHLQERLKRCTIINIVLIVALAACIVVICIAIPILATQDDDCNTSNGLTSPSIRDDCAEVRDIIVVGGGSGGVYAAWRLKQNESYANVSILLLEATNRIGGRLFSVEMPNVPFTVAEAGGMRYVPEEHPLLENVIKTLNIETKVFEMDEGNEERPYTFRDLFFQQKNLETADLPYTFLKEDEKNKTPDDVEILYFNITVPETERTKDPDKMYTVYGDPLLNYGTANVFALANSSEDARAYSIAGAGYSDIETNTNAAVFLYGASNSSDLSLGNGYRTPVEGMEIVPRELFEAFKSAGGEGEMNTTVLAIDQCAKQAEYYRVTTRDSVTNKLTSFCTKRVILSLTRSQLKRIFWNGFQLSPKAELIESVFSQKASKFFFTFKGTPFWRNDALRGLNLTKGRTLSSLPIRQQFYFTPPDSHKSNDSLFMAYNDGKNAEFWGGLASEKFTKYTGPAFVYPATQEMVRTAVRQLAIDHNTTEEIIGTPEQALIMFWNHEEAPRVTSYGPFMPSEAWHMWKPGYNFSEVAREMIKLDSNQEVYTIGEAYSTNQGWVEGAFETAEDMLKRFFEQEEIEQPTNTRRRLFSRLRLFP